MARLGFDGLETIQERWFSRESSSTKYAERLGWRMGTQLGIKEHAARIKYKSGVPELERIHYRGKENLKINTDIMTEDEYEP